MFYVFFFFQAEDGIRDANYGLEFRRVLFRSHRRVRLAGGLRRLEPWREDRRRRQGSHGHVPDARVHRAARLAAAGRGPTYLPLDRRRPEDRQSVVQGENVSVRGELGGRRKIKKTKKDTMTE